MTHLTAAKADKILSDVPEQNHFRLYMGTNIRNLKELAEALEIMSDRTFSHHVTPEKNDFSTWVKDTIGDHELSEKLKKMDSSASMANEIRKRIDFVHRKPSEHAICHKEFTKCGVNDFLVGAVVGFLIGVVIAFAF